MPRQKPLPGSVFQVPLNDGSYGTGQVIAYEPQMLNSVSCIFSDLRLWSSGEIPTRSIIASLFTTHDLLTKGRWKIIGQAPISISRDDHPFEHLRPQRWIGAKMIGSGIVEDFMNAWFGLHPWDDWADPCYLDRLLFRDRTRPDNAILKTNQAEQADAGNRRSAGA